MKLQCMTLSHLRSNRKPWLRLDALFAPRLGYCWNRILSINNTIVLPRGGGLSARVRRYITNKYAYFILLKYLFRLTFIPKALRMLERG